MIIIFLNYFCIFGAKRIPICCIISFISLFWTLFYLILYIFLIIITNDNNYVSDVPECSRMFQIFHVPGVIDGQIQLNKNKLVSAQNIKRYFGGVEDQ